MPSDQEEQLIPMSNWGKDHWSTLAFIETVMVENGFFPFKGDARMRSNRRHFRLMPSDFGIVMPREQGSRLKDGTNAENHDDWCCIQDMAAEGLLDKPQEDLDVGVRVKFSDKGMRIAQQLRTHKMNKGSFGNFEPKDIE